jgi:hypothetical protein
LNERRWEGQTHEDGTIVWRIINDPVPPPRFDAYEEEHRREMKKRQDALDKSKALLESILTDEQKKHLAEKGTIPVKGGETGTEYFIEPGYSQNIRAQMKLEDMPSKKGLSCTCPDCLGERPRIICCYMKIGAPYFDHMVAQVLYLQYAEREFLGEAYIS